MATFENSNLISLDTTTVDPPISLDPGSAELGSYMLDPVAIKNRAARFSYATNQPEKQMVDTLENSQEATLRDNEAAVTNSNLTNKRYEMYRQTLAKKQGPITPQDLTDLDMATGYNFPYRYPRDPRDILEINYAEKYMSDLNKFAARQGDSNFWNYGQQAPTNAVEAASIYGNTAAATDQLLNTLTEDAEARKKKQSTAGRVYDIAALNFPILNPNYELKMRGNVPGVSWIEGLDVGTNLERQRQALFNMPFEERSKIIRSAYETLANSNLEAASIWLQAMKGQGLDERFLNVLNTVATASDAGIIYGVGKVGFNALSLKKQVAKAVATATAAAKEPNVSQAGIIASHGNFGQAGIIAGENLLTGMAGRPLSSGGAASENLLTGRVPGNENFYHMARATLMDNMNIFDADLTKADYLPRAFQNNFIEANTVKVANTIAVLEDALRPTRVNFGNLDLAETQSLERYISRKFAGDNNNVLHLSAPFQEPMTRSWWQTMHWGNDGGTLFGSVFEAANRMAQKGLRVTLTKDQIADIDAKLAVTKDDLNNYISANGIVNDAEQLALNETIKDLEAKKAAWSKPGGATIEQQGTMFYGSMNVPLRDSDRELVRAVGKPVDPIDETPKGWFSKLFLIDRLRTAEDTFSEAHSAQRKAALYPQAVLEEVMRQFGKDEADFLKGKTKYDPVTGDLNPWYKRGIPGISRFTNRQSINRLKEVLLYSQGAKDPVTQVEGWWMNPQELKDHWIRTYGEAPTLAEAHAYDAARRTDEMQRVFTQIMVVRGQAARGGLNHLVWLKTPEGERAYSQEFVAAPLNKLSGEGGTILVVGKDSKNTKVEHLAETHDVEQAKVTTVGRTSLALKDKWNGWIKEGKYKLLLVDDHSLKPFNEMPFKDNDKLIKYVLVPTDHVETSSLKWDSVPRTGGGRFGYEYQRYLKFPNMVYEKVGGKMVANYMGDHSIVGIPYLKAGQDLRDKANRVMDLLEKKKGLQARKMFIDTGLEGALEPWDNFIAKFKRWKDSEGNWRDPVYHIWNRFEVVDTNKSIKQMSSALEDRHGTKATVPDLYNSWRDAIGDNPSKAFAVRFTDKRDADGFQAIKDIGTRTNPIYIREPAQKIDPLLMMNRAMRQTINSVFMDDYKSYAVNSWLKEAYSHLNEGDGVFSSPFASFKTITEKSFRAGTPPEIANRLYANWQKINQFTNVPTQWDTFVHGITQELVDFTYTKLGPKAALVPVWLLPRVKDPFAVLRSLTMNAILGVFSPAQLLVQSMNYATMWAISPRHATIGSLGALLHHFSLFNNNPEYLKLLDNLATKMRMPGLPAYKEGEWLEALQEMKRTGFARVGGESSLLANQHRANVIRNGMDTFLEWGRAPWKWGEANSRVGAWMIAMKEYRTKFPTGRLTDADRAQVLQRADTLYGNMSSASHSLVNAGVLSLPTQFYMYAYRLGELFWSGSRLGLTRAERVAARARIIGVHAALFGLPMSLGVTGFPAADWLRQKLLDDGFYGLTPQYVVGANFVESALHEGVIAALTAMATGKWYNPGPRYGVSGLNPVEDFLSGDKGALRILGGASVNLTLNTFQNGFIPFASKVVNGQFGDIRWMHLYDMAKEVKSIGDSGILWNALATGKWVDKNWNYLDDVTKAQAVGMFLTGVRPTSEQADLWNKREILQSRSQYQKYVEKNFDLWWNRAIMAAYKGDDDMAESYKQTALGWLNNGELTPDQLSSVMTRAGKLVERYVDRIDPRFFMISVPPNRYEKSMDAYRKQLNQIQR